MKQVTPAIESLDDASSIHQELGSELKICVRIIFAEPFQSEEDQETFENYAIQEVFNGVEPKDCLYDWRDDQELWIRHN